MPLQVLDGILAMTTWADSLKLAEFIVLKGLMLAIGNARSAMPVTEGTRGFARDPNELPRKVALIAKPYL